MSVKKAEKTTLEIFSTFHSFNEYVLNKNSPMQVKMMESVDKKYLYKITKKNSKMTLNIINEKIFFFIKSPLLRYICIFLFFQEVKSSIFIYTFFIFCVIMLLTLIERRELRMKKFKIVLLVLFLSLTATGLAAKFFFGDKVTVKDVSYLEFKSVIGKASDVAPVTLYESSDEKSLYFTVGNTKYQTETSSKSDYAKEIVSTYNIHFEQLEKGKFTAYISDILKYTIIFVLAYLLITLLVNKATKSVMNDKMSFSKAGKNIKKNKPDVTIDDVGGLSPEIKAEVLETVKILKNRDNASRYGIKAPKGILLYGPPGTGKTTLAKAIANALDANFIQMNGSEFTEMFVGVGAGRVRDLFETAKKMKPAVVFIDEIDAVAKRRGTPNMSHETEQTLNQILVEQGELRPEDQVFVLAATNASLDTLDPALFRPGRFDFKTKVDLPDYEGRKEIVKIHTKNKPLAKEVVDHLDELTKNMYGYSGADIEGLFNTAANRAFAREHTEITMDDLNYALDRNLMGSEGRQLNKPEIKKRVAYHEAGHALVNVLTKRGSVRKASIVPRGQGLGVVITIPEEFNLQTRSELIDMVKGFVAGGVAERTIFKEHSIGVSQDLEQTRRVIEGMVEKYGMSGDELQIFFDDKEKKKEMENIFKEALEGCKNLIQTHRDVFEKLANKLLEKETLSGEEIEEIVFSKPVKLVAGE
jgi:cell division protease FtsH